MKRTHLLPTAAALGLAVFAVPSAAPAQQRHGAGDAAASQERTAAAADRMHKGNGTSGGPADLLRLAQSALRSGQTKEANELLERAETRLLTGVEPGKPAQGEPAYHVSEARRALMNRDRAEAVRHTNMAIATARGGTDASGTGDDHAGADRRRGVQGGGPGAVDSGMGTLPGAADRAVVRDGGTSRTSVSRAEGVVLAQSSGTGGRGAAPPPTGLPPGDTIPGWSGPRSGATGSTSQGAAQQSPQPLGRPPTVTAPPASTLTPSLSAPSSSSILGGEPARIGGAPAGDTTRAPGSSGISGTGAGGAVR